jgi:low density lipoprotein receptor-related protein 5/6
LAVDVKSRRVFWADNDRRVIQSGSIDGGGGRQIVVDGVLGATAISVVDSFIYWTNRESRAVERANKIFGTDRTVVRSRLDHLTDLVTVQAKSSSSIGALPCSRAPCSHLCTVAANGSSQCSCPPGMVLGANRQTCIVERRQQSQTPPQPSPALRCREHEFACVVAGSPKCLTLASKCDDLLDCDDKSDETNCSCPLWHFRCISSGRCVSFGHRCDGRNDCSDGSDEKGCVPCGGLETVKCVADRLCIERSRLCDGHRDCSDGQDEQNCTAVLASHPVTRVTNHTMIVVGSSCGFMLIVLCIVVYFSWRYGSGLNWCRVSASDRKLSGSSWLSSSSSSSSTAKLRQKQASMTLTKSLVTASHGSEPSGSGMSRSPQPLFYDRVVATSSSSSVAAASASASAACYPRETLNPPPSPISTAYSAPSTVHRNRVAWRSRTSATMSPCSTDVCGGGDDDDGCCYSETSWNDVMGGMVSTTEFGYETDPLYPPPPTPCSRYVSTDIDAAVCNRYLNTGEDPAVCCCLSNATSTGESDRSCKRDRRRRHHHQQQTVAHAVSLSSFVS